PLLRSVVCADDLPREVAAKIAVVTGLPAFQTDLGAVVELRNSAHREQRAQTELRHANRPVEPDPVAGVLGPRMAHDPTLQVVVVEQCYTFVGLSITAFERVVVVEHAQGPRVVQAWPRQPVLRALIEDERRAQRRAQRKIKEEIKVVIVLILEQLGESPPVLEQPLAEEPSLPMLAADLRLE